MLQRNRSKDDLYPHDDEIESLCKEVLIELFKAIAKDRGISGEYYFNFMNTWIKIEKLLFEYSNHNNIHIPITSHSLIKRITDSDLKLKLHKTRILRNRLVHNVSEEITEKELISIDEMDKLYEVYKCTLETKV